MISSIQILSNAFLQAYVQIEDYAYTVIKKKKKKPCCSKLVHLNVMLMTFFEVFNMKYFGKQRCTVFLHCCVLQTCFFLLQYDINDESFRFAINQELTMFIINFINLVVAALLQTRVIIVK